MRLIFNRKRLSYIIRKIFFIYVLLLFCNFSFSQELNDKILESLDLYAQKVCKEWDVPGMSLAVVSGDKVVYKKSFGVKEIGKPNVVDNRTIFQIGSCSKAFSATLTAILVDKGYLNWSDKVTDFLPDFKLYDENTTNLITVEDLLTQNSGLPSYSGDIMMLFGYDAEYILNSIRYIKPTGIFRKCYSYQNNLFIVLGKVIKKATGKSWNYNVNKLIFNPLGMKSTTTDYRSYLKSKNRSIAHYSGEINSVTKPIPDFLPYNNWPYIYAPAGGINSNIDDMSKWLLFLVNDSKSLISRQNFDMLFRKLTYVSDDCNSLINKKYYYCMCWRCEEESSYNNSDIFFHAGATDGEGAYISFLRDEKIGMVVLLNTSNSRIVGEILTKTLYDMYFKKLPIVDYSNLKLKELNENGNSDETSKLTKPNSSSMPLNKNKYVGKYNNILYGMTKIRLKKDELEFSAGKRKVWIKLKYRNENSFDAVPLPGWRLKDLMLNFLVDMNNNVTGIRIEGMADGVEPIFRKIS